MYKYIFAIFHREESVAFDFIEPLDFTHRHTLLLLIFEEKKTA
jgi:hypothetical protein